MQMRKLCLIIIVLFVLAGCRSDEGYATLTAEAPEPTPSSETLETPFPTATDDVPSPPTPTEEQVTIPPFIIAPNGNGNNELVMPPECDNDECQFYLEGFGGTVGMTGEWLDTDVSTWYTLTATAIVDLANQHCDDYRTNFAFIAFIHYEDGAPMSSTPIWLRSGTFDSINGLYELTWDILPMDDGASIPEVAFWQDYACSAHGNNVIIKDIVYIER